MIAIAPLAPSDRAEWEILARGYKAFYEDETSDEEYGQTWAKLMASEGIFGLGARLDGGLAGFAHYLFHPHSWRGESCYLQDLYTDEAARGRGIATALVDAVADHARERGAGAYYWLTKEDNHRARALYERIALWRGFLRYDYPL